MGAILNRECSIGECNSKNQEKYSGDAVNPLDDAWVKPLAQLGREERQSEEEGERADPYSAGESDLLDRRMNIGTRCGQ